MEEGGMLGCFLLTIFSHSCIHCKTCDIKVPDQDIT
jgi:hypothetical protein